MAYKTYFIPTKQFAILRDSIREYNEFFTSYKLVKGELCLYDINNVAVILVDGFKKHKTGNIKLIGELENIIKTKSKIEERSKLKLEEVK